MWYHGTEVYQEVIANGFSLEFMTNGRRFGNGVYFSNSEKDVIYYGSNTIQANIDQSYILEVDINAANALIDRVIRRYSNDYMNHVNECIGDYKALSVQYIDGTKELIVYDLSIINIVH